MELPTLKGAYCECGCGEEVTINKYKPRRFVLGHWWRGKKHSAKSRAKVSAARRGMKFSPEHRANISAAQIGRKQSPTALAKKSGKNAYWYGKTGEDHNCFGRKLSPGHKAKISKGNKGLKRSAKTKARLSAANIGKKLSPEHRAKMSAANMGKTLSPEHRAKISAAISGENNPRWNGGPKPYCCAWLDSEYKEDLRERDGHTCQNPHCWNGQPTWEGNGERHSIHHINSDPKDCRPHNLITLCRSCNSRASQKGQRSYWQTLYSSMMDFRAMIVPFEVGSSGIKEVLD